MSLATLPRRKQAGQIGSSERSFETALSNLAFSSLRDRAPGLLDHLVGFQLLDKNDDSTRAVGIFGFQLGEQWLYAPVFFMNGSLKGSELLYLKNQDIFVPMKENWINYVLNRRPPVLGEGVNRNSRSLGVLQPNMTSFMRPGGLKYANQFPDWVLHGLTGLAKARQVKEYDGIDLPTFLKKAGRPAIRMLLSWCQEFPKLAEAIDKLHGFGNLFGEAIKAAALAQSPKSLRAEPWTEGMRTDAKPALGAFDKPRNVPGAVRPGTWLGGAQAGASAGSSPTRSYFLRGLPPSHLWDSVKKRHVKNPDESTRLLIKGGSVSILPLNEEPIVVPDVAIITKEAADRSGLPLSGEDSETLLRDGYLVRDKRAADQISRAYTIPVRIQGKANLTNPTVTGIFDVLVRPGDFDRMLVIVQPYACDSRKNLATAVRLDKDKNWVNTDQSNMWISLPSEVAEDTGWFDELPKGPRTLSVGGIYVAVTSSGQGSVPFKVKTDLGKSEHGRSYCVSFRDSAVGPVPRYRRCYDYDGSSMPEYSDDYRVHLRSKPGVKMRQFGGDLFIPDDAKILAIYAPPKSKEDEFCCVSDYSRGHDPAPILLGNWLDVRRAIFQKTAALELTCDGSRFCVGGRHLRNRDALAVLVFEHGLHEKAAQAVLDAAQKQQSVHFRIKYAAPYPLQMGAPVGPTISDPMMGGSDTASGMAQTQLPQSEMLPIEGLQGTHNDPSVYDAMQPPQQTGQMITPGPNASTMGTAMTAARTGQRGLFDTAVISGLLRSGRPESLVRDSSGDILKAMDKLGRLYFSSLHRSDDWEDLYGKADAGEVRDAILNSFESLGDVVLYLKEHQIEELDEGLHPEVEEIAEEQ